MEIVRLTESQRRLAILIPAGVVFLWIGWALAVSPVITKIRNLKMSISTADERSSLIMDIKGFEKRQLQAEEFLTTEQTRHDLLNKLTAFANESGFEIASLTPGFEQSQPYGRIFFEIKAQAKFPNLARFLSKLEDFKPGVVVNKITVTSEGYRFRETSEKPQIDLTLEAYLR